MAGQSESLSQQDPSYIAPVVDEAAARGIASTITTLITAWERAKGRADGLPTLERSYIWKVRLLLLFPLPLVE